MGGGLPQDLRGVSPRPSAYHQPRAYCKAALDATFKYNTFVRKATFGDWVNYFNAADGKAFKKIAGQTLVRLGYESGLNWQSSNGGACLRPETLRDRKWLKWPGRKDL